MKSMILLVFTFHFLAFTYAQKNVTLIIKFDTKPTNKIIPVSYNYITNKFQFLETKIIKIDSLKEKVLISVNRPIEINISKHKLFIEAGQIYYINYYLKKDSIALSGKYPGNGIYAQLIDNSNFRSVNFQEFKGNEIILKEILKDTHNRKIAKIDSLFNLNKMSIACHKYLYNEVHYSYISSLIDIGNSLNIADSIKKALIIDEVKSEKFSDSNNLSSKFYGFAMSSLCSDILTKRMNYEYTADHLNMTIKNIKSNFIGIQSEFLLSYLFRRYCRKQLTEYSKVIDTIYIELMQVLKNDEYKNVVSYWYEYYNKTNKKIPEFILNTQLYKTNMDSISLKSLIENDKLYIIDFWASWCSPCIKQINKYNEKISTINNKFNIIFISIDEDIEMHQKLANKLKINSYFFSPYNSKFIKDYFAIPPIPRSVLIENMILKECDYDFYSFLEIGR